MKKSFKFLGVVLLIARVDLVFPAESHPLTQADVDSYNVALSARLATLKATAPGAIDEIRAIERQLKVGGVWPEDKVLPVIVLRRRNSLKGAIALEMERLMSSCNTIQGCYEHLVTQFEIRINTLEGLEATASDITITSQGMLRTGFGLSREIPLPV